MGLRPRGHSKGCSGEDLAPVGRRPRAGPPTALTRPRHLPTPLASVQTLAGARLTKHLEKLSRAFQDTAGESGTRTAGHAGVTTHSGHQGTAAVSQSPVSFVKFLTDRSDPRREIPTVRRHDICDLLPNDWGAGVGYRRNKVGSPAERLKLVLGTRGSSCQSFSFCTGSWFSQQEVEVCGPPEAPRVPSAQQVLL